MNRIPTMTQEESELAIGIFEAYNDFRLSRGYSKLKWSEECADMAYKGACGCADTKRLTHGLGIPQIMRVKYSDVIQYASYKIHPVDAILRWAESDGHRKQLQCNTASKCGIGVHVKNNIWYIVLVYDFINYNYAGE